MKLTDLNLHVMVIQRPVNRANAPHRVLVCANGIWIPHLIPSRVAFNACQFKVIDFIQKNTSLRIEPVPHDDWVEWHNPAKKTTLKFQFREYSGKWSDLQRQLYAEVGARIIPLDPNS